MISKVKYRSSEFSYPVFEYLYPYIVKLVWRKKLLVETKDVIVLPEEFADGFKIFLRDIMLELLDEFYEEPDEEVLQEYRNRYEKIQISGRQYVLNIVTSGKDRTVFQIFSLFDWIEKQK